jgi:DNA-binding Lrp family transcriptional regulator
MYGDKPSYPIYVWNGILEAKHRKAIGPALWEFLWCVDRITEEKGGVGVVLGRKPVTFAEIAEDLGVSAKTVQRHIDRLQQANYIELILTPRGHQIRVLKSCKFKNGMKQRVAHKKRTSNAHVGAPKVSTQVGQKCPPRQDNPVHPPDKSVLPNIRESSMSKQLEKAAEKTAHTALEPAPNASVFIPPEKDFPSREEPPPIPSLSAIVKGIPPMKTEAELQARENLLARQREQILTQYPRAKPIGERHATA